MSVDGANSARDLGHIDSNAYLGLALVLDAARRHQGRWWRDESRAEC